jgi:heme exporter protein CcmD
LGYVVAAYAVVIGSVLAYAIWVQRERRRIGRELAALAREPKTADARG